MDFYCDVLGSPKRIVAPMVEGSELAWRMLSRAHGAELCYTPMLHAGLFVENEVYRREQLQTCPADRPLLVQFCANDPDTLAAAAKLVAPHCDGVDLNLGCPQSIARRGRYGAFLQDDWPLIERLVKAVVDAGVVITVKIRVFPDAEKTLSYARMIESAGASLLTVHGRTREQKGAETGLADWEQIAAVKRALRIPVFANGNIQYAADMDRCLAETGVDGVMIAEGSLHNPYLFDGTLPHVCDVCDAYLAMVDAHPCALSTVRGHLFKILHHLLQRHRDLRTRLGNSGRIAELKAVVAEARQCAEADVNAAEYSEAELPHPYWICQPYERKKKPETEKDGEVKVKAKKPKAPPGMSKRQLKRMLKYPNAKRPKTGDGDNPPCVCKGSKISAKCDHGLCKACCRSRGERCEGHRLWISTSADGRENDRTNDRTNDRGVPVSCSA